LDDVIEFTQLYDLTFKDCRAELKVEREPPTSWSCKDVLPLLALATNAPGLEIEFHWLMIALWHAFNDSEVKDWNRLINLSRTNALWRHYLSTSTQSVL
jgi:hypothetical protein